MAELVRAQVRQAGLLAAAADGLVDATLGQPSAASKPQRRDVGSIVVGAGRQIALQCAGGRPIEGHGPRCPTGAGEGPGV
jgi:hypothetical protein